MTEEVCRFGDRKSLVGIVTLPERPDHGQDLPAIILLNAGLAHRVGPQRLYVKMARHMASQGFAVLRFDFSGIGDSEPRTDRLHFPENPLLPYSPDRRSCRLLDAFIIRPCLTVLTKTSCAARSLRSTGVTPLPCYYRPSRYPLAFHRFPG